jgi:tetratricopeptide (TPR) repeat protein
VAVFLFGYSLTPHARRRRGLFAGVAAALAAGGAVSVAVTAADTPQLPPEAAAAAFADGRVAYDSERFDLAVRHLTRSLDAWPEYAQAHALRARAEFAAGSPQLDIPLSLTTERALIATVDDEDRAIELGAEDSGLIVNHGFNLFALGLRRDDDAAIRRGLRFSEEGKEARRTDPVPAFNAAVALLALGDVEEARAAYAEAVQRTVFADEARHVRRDDTAAYEFYLAEALTDLDLLAARRGRRLGEEIERIKREVVAPITRAAYGESLRSRPRPAAAGRLRIAVGPGSTQFEIVAPRHIGVDADVSAQWSFAAPDGLGWQVLPDVSGAVNNEIRVQRDGTLVHRAGLLALTGSCLSPGRYRLDLYVDGRLIARTARRAAFPRLTAARLRSLGLALCLPEGWRPVGGRAPGLLDGYERPDRRAGTLVFSVSRAAVGAGQPSKALSRRIMAAALERFSARLPAGLAGGRDVDRPFMPLAGELVRTYRYPGGRALVGAGAMAHSDQLLVAVTYGPSRFVAGRGGVVFASLTREGG